MLSSNADFEDGDWDGARQSVAAIIRDLERMYLNMGLGGSDFAGATPKPFDQTVAEDGNYGFQAVTTDMLTDALDRQAAAILSRVPTVSYPISIANGGTGANNATSARSNLGLGTMATVASPAPVANGGTGATDAATARSNLGLGALAQYDGYNGHLILNTYGMRAVTLYTSGSGNFTVPSNAYAMMIVICGGGGGGGGANNYGSRLYVSATSGGATTTALDLGLGGGAGGDGGVLCVRTQTSPGDVWGYIVGAGGSNGAANGGSGGDGGYSEASYFSTKYQAYGGKGGTAYEGGLGGGVTNASGRSSEVIQGRAGVHGCRGAFGFPVAYGGYAGPGILAPNTGDTTYVSYGMGGSGGGWNSYPSGAAGSSGAGGFVAFIY